jgi:hypothetical protein
MCLLVSPSTKAEKQYPYVSGLYPEPPCMMPPRAKSQIARTADNNALIQNLLAELAKKNNHTVLEFRQANASVAARRHHVFTTVCTIFISLILLFTKTMVHYTPLHIYFLSSNAPLVYNTIILTISRYIS